VYRREESVEGRPLDDRTDNDATLIIRTRRGDVTAYELLVRRYQAVAGRVAHVLCGPHEASDVAQEGFVEAWRVLERCSLLHVQHPNFCFPARLSSRQWNLRGPVTRSRRASRSSPGSASASRRPRSAGPEIRPRDPTEQSRLLAYWELSVY
jgi:hypothetical protein